MNEGHQSENEKRRYLPAEKYPFYYCIVMIPILIPRIYQLCVVAAPHPPIKNKLLL